MQGVDHCEPLVAFVPIGRQVDGHLFGLRVEFGDLRLPHHRFPDVSILIHRDHEAARRKAGLRHGDRIAGDLLGSSFEMNWCWKSENQTLPALSRSVSWGAA